MESIQKAQPKEVGGFSSSCHTLAGNDKAFLGHCCQDGKAAKKVKIGLTGQRKLLVGNRNRGSSVKSARMLRVKGFSDKGKERKKKRRGIVRGSVRGSINFSEYSATSSEDGTRESFFLDSLKVRGECSKRKGDGGGSGLDSLEGRSLPGGPPKPKRVSVINTPNSPIVYKNMYGGVKLCVDLGLVEEVSSKALADRKLKPILEEGEAFSSSVDSLVRATVLVEEERAREDELFQYSEAIEVEAAKDKVRVHNQEVNCHKNCVEQCDRGSDDNSSSMAKEVMVLATVAVEEKRAIEVEQADAAVKKRQIGFIWETLAAWFG
ncbi:hypothetical protein Q3G72_026896 [Acer saccharum]|nr:hypothetical protein Q3G72_026896 [Acer saccharum]